MMRAILYSCILLSTYAQATFWQDLKQAYPAKYEATDFVCLCIEEADKDTSEEYVKEFARNIMDMVKTYPPKSPEWESILIVFDVFIRENRQHPMEIRDLLLDQDIFVKKLKKRLSFLFKVGIGADSPKNTKQ